MCDYIVTYEVKSEYDGTLTIEDVVIPAMNKQHAEDIFYESFDGILLDVEVC